VETSAQAGNLGLQSLYHYQDFNLNSSDDHVGRLTDILKHHRIWCSDPAKLNDPWDCKPYFDPARLYDPQTRAATAEARISTRTGGVELKPVDEKLRDPGFLREKIRQISRALPSLISFRWGIYCLSPYPSLTLMWSHYARDHKGICLEFAVPNTKFQGAFKVQYQNAYPALFLGDPESPVKMLLVKSDVWAYEQEFRLICRKKGLLDRDLRSPLILDGNYLQIGPNDLLSIIMGCQIGAKARKTIRKLVKEHAPSVKVRQALRSMNKYRLVISPDDESEK
jgi:hypothetical protein